MQGVTHSREAILGVTVAWECNLALLPGTAHHLAEWTQSRVGKNQREMSFTFDLWDGKQ